MTNWNKLLIMLNHVFGFANCTTSKVKKLSQGFDNNTNEHVIWLEYRVRQGDGSRPLTETSRRDMRRLREIAADLARARASDE